jgi:hypothetical protein
MNKGENPTAKSSSEMARGVHSDPALSPVRRRRAFAWRRMDMSIWILWLLDLLPSDSDALKGMVWSD